MRFGKTERHNMLMALVPIITLFIVVASIVKIIGYAISCCS